MTDGLSARLNAVRSARHAVDGQVGGIPDTPTAVDVALESRLVAGAD